MLSSPTDDRARALEQLVADGFVVRGADGWVPGNRWHAAMLRAATRLQAMGMELVDLRVPIAWALAEAYAGARSDDELVAMIAVLTPLTAVR